MASPNFKLPFHSIFLAVGVGIPLWVIALGGFGAVTGKCNAQSGAKSVDCGQDYALEWFSIWLEFVVLALLATVVFVKSLAKLNLAVMSLLTTATVLFISHANYYVRSAHEAILDEVNGSAVRAAAAGAVLLTLYNFGLIFYISWLDVGSTAASATPANDGNQVNVAVDPMAAMKTMAGTVKGIMKQQHEQHEPVTAETEV